ncbi:hypothetical protein MNBD_GAMMA01-2177 [hydrothermal vent metagenome]|uniref:Uncharacterized protein n=1 Tax=hydrothermal vent metagenome TaxID=652676 RepID=A0A3B0VRM2_9ZZZZ
MKIIKKLIVILAITSIPSTVVYAQDLNLTYADGNISLPLSPANSMSIDPNSGDINIATTANAENIGTSLGLQPVGNAPDISFQVILNTAATSATINATITEDAVYCQKGGLWGTSLTASNPPNTFVTGVTGQGTSNSSNYTLTCGNSFGKITENATVSGIVAVNNPVVTITATPTSVTSGGSSTINWAVTNAPDSCTFTGDWPTNITFTSNGPFSFSENNITSNKTYSVLCDNSAPGNSGTQTATVVVQGQSAWSSCAAPSEYVLNGAEDRTVIANALDTSQPFSYSGLFSELQGGAGTNSPWPGNFGESIQLTLNKNKYIAAQFTTNNIGYNAALQVSGTSNNQGTQSQNWTYMISECPGAFDSPVNNQPACIMAANSLRWSTKSTPTPGFPPGYFCRLDKNKTYYLNLIHSDNSEGNGYATSDCQSSSSYCGILAQMLEVNL